jgi:lysozyme
MPPILPVGKPRLSTDALVELIDPFELDREQYPVIVVGVRAYYRDTMGAPGVDDRGIYDDALFLHTPSVTAAFNGNTDPSRYRTGSGTGAAKGMACLRPGAWYVHSFDLHKGKYLALCQRAGEVTVTRDGDPPYADTGMFGINIHRGGYSGTSSLGCQTIHPTQWDSFINLAVDQCKRYYGARWRKTVIPYILVSRV